MFAVTLHPRLVPPPPDEDPRRQDPGTAPYDGVVGEVGYRPDEGMDAASAGLGVMPVFQPVVSLPEELVVGYEALARWPMSDTMTATNVFSFANATRQAEVLDQRCIDAAVYAALDSDLPRDSLLLINTEPVAAHRSRASYPALDEACERFQVAFELTERHLLSHPQALLEKVAAIRDDGIAIAIDDVGAHPDSLAVLDILEPDIIKVDMTMIQNIAQRDRANTLTGVLAHHERTGASIIAEGVETDEDLEQALAVGADLAQGFRFGHGRPLSRQERAAVPPPPMRIEHREGGSAHAAAEDDRKPLRVAPRRVVAAFVRHFEEQARNSRDHPIVLAALQRAQDVSHGALEVYREIAATSPLVVILGRDMPADLGGGVRGVELHPNDPLGLEWIIVALGTDTCRALVARELPSLARHDSDPRYEFLITSDRGLVDEGRARSAGTRRLIVTKTRLRRHYPPAGTSSKTGMTRSVRFSYSPNPGARSTMRA